MIFFVSDFSYYVPLSFLLWSSCLVNLIKLKGQASQKYVCCPLLIGSEIYTTYFLGNFLQFDTHNKIASLSKKPCHRFGVYHLYNVLMQSHVLFEYFLFESSGRGMCWKHLTESKVYLKLNEGDLEVHVHYKVLI